jgi:alkane 1-monooxygenase
MISSDTAAKVQSALPFWISFLLIPAVWLSAVVGGWWVLIIPVLAWYLFSALDVVGGLNLENVDPDTADEHLSLYVLLTSLWVPIQFLTIFGLIYYAGQAEHLGTWEKIGLFFSVGAATGTIGINYSHELMHQKNKRERFLGDALLAMVLYSHFRSEHLLVHHRYVGTPRDPVTARYGEGFHRYFPRVLRQCWHSAFGAEKAMLARKDLPWTDLSNPFFRYWALQVGFIMLAFYLVVWQGFCCLSSKPSLRFGSWSW